MEKMISCIGGNETAQTLDASYFKGPGARNGKEGEVIATESTEEKTTCTSVVRRLTPLECERLQGFPDNWSKYGMDEDGNVYELADTARYKLQGNSIARPFWTYLLRRIAAQYERTATLGSLFDGQAGFPLCWTEVGGIPVWSSEIDKHPQAVARYHFPEEEIDAD